MKMEQLIAQNQKLKFVIVGHVDHGKSTLIGRLLFDTDSLPEGKIDEIKKICDALGKDIEFAYVMDHLEEERDQGITIDTAQTFFHTALRDYVIIDAPGHREFTKNMITGASQADAALLIIDTSEGLKEQTRRHAYILGLLGLGQVIVVLNKLDLVHYSEKVFNQVARDARRLLAKIGISPEYIIPISAKEGDNIANRSTNIHWYTGPTVLEALDSFRTGENRSQNPLRFPVQDVYNIGGKRIIVGRIEAGTLRTGQEIIVLPSEERTTIRTIEEFLKEGKTSALTGESIGVTVSDKLFIDRGNVICSASDPETMLPVMTKEINGNLFWMDKVPLKRGEHVRFKCATQETGCTIEAIRRRIDSSTLEVLEEDAGALKNREVGEIVLTFGAPIVVDDFNTTPELGRFVIERGYDTVGGGIITHLGPGSGGGRQ